MNDRRKALVKMAFDILDKDGSGEITVDEMMAVYDVSKNPEVSSGKKTPKQAMIEYMAQWQHNAMDGIITLQEFEDHYKEVSASIDDDDYFELMIRNAWRIAGGTGAAANTANKRVLVTNKDGSQRVVTVNNELGMKAGDKRDILARLGQQGVKAAGIDLYGGMDTRDKAKSSTNRPQYRFSGSRR